MIYRARLEPFQEGIRHTIPNRVERLTQVTPGAPYLFETSGECPRELLPVIHELTRTIAENLRDNYIKIEVDGAGVLHFETGKC